MFGNRFYVDDINNVRNAAADLDNNVASGIVVVDFRHNDHKNAEHIFQNYVFVCQKYSIMNWQEGGSSSSYKHCF